MEKELRDQRLTIKLTKKERYIYGAMAKKLGLKLSQYVRVIMRQHHLIEAKKQREEKAQIEKENNHEDSTKV